MAIENAVMQLNATMKELIETLKNKEPKNAEPEEQKEKQANAVPLGLEDVRSSLIQLKEAKDHKTAKAVLKQFGVQKIQDLAEKDYKRCIELCRKEAA